MGKTYRNIIKNKFEKKKLHILKQKQIFEEEGEEDEQQDEEEILSKVREENRT